MLERYGNPIPFAGRAVRKGDCNVKFAGVVQIPDQAGTGGICNPRLDSPGIGWIHRAIERALLGGIPHGNVVEQADAEVHSAGEQDQHEGQADGKFHQALAARG